MFFSKLAFNALRSSARCSVRQSFFLLLIVRLLRDLLSLVSVNPVEGFFGQRAAPVITEYHPIIGRHMSTAPGRIMGKPSVKALRKRLSGRVADDLPKMSFRSQGQWHRHP